MIYLAIISFVAIGVYAFFKIADMNRTPEELKRKELIKEASKIKNAEDRKKFLHENIDLKQEGQNLYEHSKK